MSTEMESNNLPTPLFIPTRNGIALPVETNLEQATDIVYELDEKNNVLLVKINYPNSSEVYGYDASDKWVKEVIDKVDRLNIATPDELDYDYAATVLENGVKNLIEQLPDDIIEDVSSIIQDNINKE